ncbi:MAG TPA: CYTH domain-containing protein [Candidatus Limnocylindria bacterium]|nr:CYTH domain-containing protein [Candidatus Limnocylindria bacterium]
MATEVEARFRATDPGALEELAEVPRLGPATLGPGRTFDEVDTYLDTGAGDLAAERWACRLRTRGQGHVVSLKGPREPVGDGTIHRRPELEGPATAAWDPAEWPPSEARDLVGRLRRGAPLEERLTLRQVRTERPVLVDGRRIATLSLDTVTVVHAGAEHGTFAVVEVELGGDGPEAEATLAEIAAALAARPDLGAEHRSKLAHALELIGAT